MAANNGVLGTAHKVRCPQTPGVSIMSITEDI